VLSDVSLPDPDAIFQDFRLSGRDCVIAAVSGGSDSLALLVLLHVFLRRHSASPRLLAVTVDHALRPGSAGEAKTVAAFCAACDIDHQIAVWRGPKPSTGISAAAREARHRLLAEAAAAAGTDLVFTGHTQDDQAETVTMRASRGSGRGAAGIALATLFDGRIWFARPLLNIRRSALRAYLKQAGVTWIEDPTNRDERYERARTRIAMDIERFRQAVEHSRRAAADRELLGRNAAEVIVRHAECPLPGLVRLDDGFLSCDRDATRYALRILLAVVGGREHLPDDARTAALLDKIRQPPLRATLSRTVVRASKKGFYFHRESRDLPFNPLGDAPLVWDGRYLLYGKGAAGISVGPLGIGNAQSFDMPANLPSSVFRGVLAAEPALWKGGKYLGLAREMPDLTVTPALGPWQRYLPSFDFAPAKAVASLLDIEPLPVLPFASHNER